jgi:hypothetical protein
VPYFLLFPSFSLETGDGYKAQKARECLPQNIISLGGPAMQQGQPRGLLRIIGSAIAFFSINVRVNATICCGVLKRIFLSGPQA